jgi:hypothetical protein
MCGRRATVHELSTPGAYDGSQGLPNNNETEFHRGEAMSDEVERAIVAHAFWKHRLYFAMATRQCDLTPDVARSDRACPFGKWLHGLDDETQAGAQWKRVAALHAEFHLLAGDALEAALEGRGDEALDLLALGGDFSQVSARLIAALHCWNTVAADTEADADADGGDGDVPTRSPSGVARA